MPELKHNFLKGRMNKDLDERLVPNGEYRDALNIEISTSEDSNTGAVQNVKGNAKVTVLDHDGNSFMSGTNSANAVSVGTVANDSENVAFNLIHLASDLVSAGDLTHPNKKIGVKSDVITKFSPNPGSETGTTTPIVTDVFETRTLPRGPQTTLGLIDNFDTEIIQTIAGVDFYGPKGVRVGMRVNIIFPNGSEVYSASNEIIVTSVNYNTDPALVTISTSIPSPDLGGQSPSLLTAAQITGGAVWRFTSDRILNFQPGTSEIESNTSGTPTSYTPNATTITGLNYSDGILFYTDNLTEPKKIVVKDFEVSDFKRTITSHSVIFNNIHFEEEHVTVIKKAPRLAPKVEAIAQTSSSGNNVINLVLFGDASFQGGFNLTYSPGITIYSVIDQIAINAQANVITTYAPIDESFAGYEVGDLVELTGSTLGLNATATVTTVNTLGPTGTQYILEILDLDPNYVAAAGTTDETWAMSPTVSNPLNEKNFCYFSYRYKYKNGEYSSLAPYSKAVFVPGVFQYTTANGQNAGMRNHLKSINVYDFVEHDIPFDVEQIEIIYKSSSSENPVIMKTVETGSVEATAKKVLGSKNSGLINISSDVFGSTLPTLQQLRTYDAVPRVAKSQEITSSRLLFGNYVENYDIKDTSNSSIDIATSNNYKSFESNTEEFNVISSLDDFSGRCDPAFDAGTHYSDIANSPFLLTTAQTIPTAQNTNSFAGRGPGINGQDWFNMITDMDTPHGYPSNFVPPLASGPEVVNRVPFDDVINGGANYDSNNREYVVSTQGDYNISATIPYEAEARFYRNDSSNPESVIECTIAVGIMLIHELANGTSSVIDLEVESDGNIFLNQNTFHVDGFASLDGSITADVGDKIYAEVSKVSFKFRDTPGGLSPCNLWGCAYHIGNAFNSQASINIVGPSTSQTISVDAATPKKSVKSGEKYQIGVIYGDKYGRESSVLLDEKNEVIIPKTQSTKKNILVANIKSEAPYWADYFKLYVKEIMPEYYNIMMHSAYPADLSQTPGQGSTIPNQTQSNFFQATAHAWVSFNSNDRSKIEIGDSLVIKKRHGGGVVTDDASWKVLDIVNNAVSDEDSAGSTSFTINDVELMGANFESINGKFFVKIEADSKFDDYVLNLTGSVPGLATLLPGNSTYSSNGAVFEVRKNKIIDLDLFYEASQAYPIRLREDNVGQYIERLNRVVIYHDFNSNMVQADIDNFNTNNSAGDLFVNQVDGAKLFGKLHTNLFENSFNSSSSHFGQGYVRVILTSPLDPSITLPTGTIVSFMRDDGGFVSGQLIGDLNGNAFIEYGNSNTGSTGALYLKPFSHKSNEFHVSDGLPIGLNWWNVISFTNGVESDRILDDFNSDTVYKYTNVGKVSGFEASRQNESYEETRRSNSIIFSQVINPPAKQGYNEFILAEDIIKEVNKEYGSIQKLYARMGDVITFCENKVLRILSSGKDAIFNADGNQQLIASKNVLGQAVPYLGEYGISTNPESFAAEEYRIYFADVKRGSICRLSRDGITPISEAGMNDWFNDNLKNTQAAVGSYDGKKNEYNLTIHNVTNPGASKKVYTLGFKENVKGWTSFKSFIKEQGVSLKNSYYTMDKGLMYLHHPDELTHNYCEFYGTSNNSSITDIFSEEAGSVKLYKTISYEGTQSKVVKFTDEVVGGVTYNDGEYYNEIAKNGWHVESITTDLQEGVVDEFIEKEGKWFNYIKGIETDFVNANEAGGTASGNVDFNEFSVQGIGGISADATTTGTIPGQSYSFDLNIIADSSSSNFWSQTSSTGSLQVSTLNDYNSGVANFVITPDAGYGIAAQDFTDEWTAYVAGTGSLTVGGNHVSDFVSLMTFTDTDVAYSPANTVTVVVTLATTTNITQDTVENIVIPNVVGVVLPIQYEAIVNINGGVFSPAQDPMTFSIFSPNVTNLQFVLLNSTTTTQQYLVTFIIPGGYTGNIMQLNIYSTAQTFNQDPSVSYTLPGPANQIQNYTTSTSHSYMISSVDIDYTPVSTEQPYLDDNNTIDITLSYFNSHLQYAEYINGSFNPLGPIWTVTGGATTQIPVDTNNGPFTASITSDPNGLLNAGSLIVNHDSSNTGGSYVQVDVNQGTTNIDAVIEITSVANGQLTDTITLRRNTVPTINAYAGWLFNGDVFGDPNYSGSNSVTDLTGAYSVLMSGTSSSSFATLGYIDVNTNAPFGSASLPFDESQHLTKVDTGDGTSWITFGFVATNSNGIPNGASGNFTTAANATNNTRSMDVVFAHPDDSSVTTTMTITQLASQAPSTGNLTFRQATATSPTDGLYTDISQTTIDVAHNVGTFNLYVKIPDSDKTVPPIGFYGWDQNTSSNNIQTVGSSAVNDPWYINDGSQSGGGPYDDNIATLAPANTVWWQISSYGAPVAFTPPGSNQSLISNEANYTLTITLDENNAAAEGDDNLNTTPLPSVDMMQFPTERYFEIYGFNPHNSGTIEDNFVTIRQLPEPRTVFADGVGQIISFGNVSVPNLLNNVLPQVRSNGSVPGHSVELYSTLADAQSQTNPIVGQWITITSNLTAVSGTTNLYEFTAATLDENFSGSARYAVLSVYHDTLNPATTVATSSVDDTDFIILSQATVVPEMQFLFLGTQAALISQTTVTEVTSVMNNGFEVVQTFPQVSTYSYVHNTRTAPTPNSLELGMAFNGEYGSAQNLGMTVNVLRYCVDSQNPQDAANWTTSTPSWAGGLTGFTVTNNPTDRLNCTLDGAGLNSLPANGGIIEIEIIHAQNTDFRAIMQLYLI